MRLDKVTSFILDKLVTQKLQDGRLDNSGGLSPKTVQNIVIIIKSAFKFAHREFHIPNVAENIGLPRVSAKEIEVFSNEEIVLLTQYLTADCDISKMGILLCLYTGIRLGEVCALKWSDFDFQENFLKVRRTIQRIQNPEPEPPKTKVIIDSPKSVKSIRDIPLPNNLSKDLRRYKYEFFVSLQRKKELSAILSLFFESRMPKRLPGCVSDVYKRQGQMYRIFRKMTKFFSLFYFGHKIPKFVGTNNSNKRE